jgi:enoyl-CoA hydratase/carnithine racemase
VRIAQTEEGNAVSFIRVDKNGPVRTVTMTRGEKRNALSIAMLDEMYAAFTEAPEAHERVVVIRAEGPVFCSGMDLKERLGNMITHGETPIERVLHAIETHPLPVVAVVAGDAIAGGNEIALHADFVVASSAARFGMSLAQIGLAPTFFLAKKLMEVAGPVATREVLLLGDPLPAQRMYDLGVIYKVAEPDQLEAAASAVIGRLAANAPLSLKAIKALLVREMEFRDHIEHDDIDEMIAAARASEDAKEGLQARLAKRPANFKGV